jgi:hypothetical protein
MGNLKTRFTSFRMVPIIGVSPYFSQGLSNTLFKCFGFDLVVVLKLCFS